MEPELSLPYSQVPDTCPYPQPDQFSPYPPPQLVEYPFEYYAPIYAKVSKVVSFPEVSPPKILRQRITTCVV
jgi:hypothetical protein